MMTVELQLELTMTFGRAWPTRAIKNNSNNKIVDEIKQGFNSKSAFETSIARLLQRLNYIKK